MVSERRLRLCHLLLSGSASGQNFSFPFICNTAIQHIASAILVYGLDKLDIFGVQRDREHAAILQELDTLISETDGRVEKMYQDEMNRMEKMKLQLSGA